MVYRPQQRIFMPSAATVAAVSILDLKAHLRVDHDAEDDVIQGMGLAAEALVEQFTQRLLTVRACVLNLPGLPNGLEPVELPGGEVAALTFVTVDGVALSGCSIIAPNLLVRSTDWPATVAENYPASVAYTAGFSAIPTALRHAVKVIVADLYETRSSSGPGSTVPFAATALMQPWRVIPI